MALKKCKECGKRIYSCRTNEFCSSSCRSKRDRRRIKIKSKDVKQNE